MEFVHPSTWLISGPTGCGKTQFIIRLLCGNQITPAPTRVIWVYAEWQPDNEKVIALAPSKNVKFTKKSKFRQIGQKPSKCASVR
jgi:KaiC/GvpD/RAD55 family RecA-like ATPase